jgi:Flp pilus assembly protein TadG
MSANFKLNSRPKSIASVPSAGVRGGQRGSTLIEYTFVLLMSLTMLFGIIDFGRALYAYHYISNAAREGTRYASVRGATCDNATVTPCPATTREIQNYATNAPLGIDTTRLTAVASFVSNGVAVCSVTNNYPGCGVQVTVRYRFQFLFPLMPSNFRMSSTSQMIISR